MNRPSYSESRINTLRECMRKYYYNYYLSDQGWLKNSSEDKKQAYMLKNMTNLPMFVGSIVHSVIELDIKSYKEHDEWMGQDESTKLCIRLFKDGWLKSKSREWKNNPKSTNLFEHFYGVKVNKDELLNYKNKIEKSFDNFYNGPIFKILNNLKQDEWLTLENFQKFSLNTGEEIIVKIDLGFRYNNIVVLVDWKTGKKNDRAIEQLTTYAMYAMKKWTISHKDIKILPIYIATMDIKDQLEMLSVTKEMILSKAETIKNELNILYEVDKHKNDQSFFKLTDNTNLCNRCNFKAMCPGGER